MQRITITIDDPLLETIDRLCEERGYGSRSEALRDIVRNALAASRAEEDEATGAYGALSYVYSHNTRDLARRLTDEGHHHGISVANLHVHLNREECLEVAILRGSVRAMRAYADTVTTQRGVRYGHLHVVAGGDGHDHDADEGRT